MRVRGLGAALGRSSTVYGAPRAASRTPSKQGGLASVKVHCAQQSNFRANLDRICPAVELNADERVGWAKQTHVALGGYFAAPGCTFEVATAKNESDQSHAFTNPTRTAGGAY